MDGNISNAGGGGEDEGKVGGVEKAKEGCETFGFDDLELVFLWKAEKEGGRG